MKTESQEIEGFLQAIHEELAEARDAAQRGLDELAKLRANLTRREIERLRKLQHDQTN